MPMGLMPELPFLQPGASAREAGAEGVTVYGYIRETLKNYRT